MSAKTNPSRQSQPTDVGVAVFAPVPKLRIVDLRVAGHAVRSGARRSHVATVVAVLALRSSMSSCKAQARVIRPDVGYFAPIAFIVARRTLGIRKPSFMRVLVTGHTIRLEPQVCRMPAAVSTVVAVLAADRCMRSFERPSCEAMIEALLLATGPTNERCVPSEVLDVAPAAFFAPILASVETGLLLDANGQIIVAREARIGVNSLACRVALPAARVALEIGMIIAQLSGREKLCPDLSGPQRPSNCRGQHPTGEDHQRSSATSHQEKIHRYP